MKFEGPWKSLKSPWITISKDSGNHGNNALAYFDMKSASAAYSKSAVMVTAEHYVY